MIVELMVEVVVDGVMDEGVQVWEDMKVMIEVPRRVVMDGELMEADKEVNSMVDGHVNEMLEVVGCCVGYGGGVGQGRGGR